MSKALLMLMAAVIAFLNAQLLQAQTQSVVLLDDPFDGSIASDWTVFGNDAQSTATPDGPESAFTAGTNPSGTSLRLDDRSTSAEVNLRFTMPDGSVAEGERLTIQFDLYSVNSILPIVQIQDGTSNAGRLSLLPNFQHRNGGAWETLASTNHGTWYRVVYTFKNDEVDTADISLTPFEGNTSTWTDLNVEANKISVDSVLFAFNIPSANTGREFLIDNVVVSETTSWFGNLNSNSVASHPTLQWQHFGPGLSGYIEKFFINNGDPNAMYTELDMGNGHVTVDGGNYWTSYRDWDSDGTHPNGPTWMDFSWQDPDFGIMIGKNMTYSTEDRGRSWNQLGSTHPSNSEKHNVVAVDPSNDNNWYIGAGQGWMIKFTHYTKDGIVETANRNHSEGFIMHSKDRGQSWTEVSAPFPADSSFSRILVDPRDSDVVYASCQHGVFKSIDGGDNWAIVPGNGLPHNQPRDMAFYYDADSGEFLLYIVEITHYMPAAAKGLAGSSDKSESKRLSSRSVDLLSPFSKSIGKRDLKPKDKTIDIPDSAFLGGDSIITTGGVYRSADGGINWDNLTGDLAIDMSQISLSAYRNKYYRAIAYWLEISESEAKSLYPDLPTATFSQFHQMSVDPTNKDRIYLVHNFKHDYSFPPGNIWMTENGGTNWYAAAREGPYWTSGQDSGYWQSRAIQPTGMNTQFAHVDREHRNNNNTQTGPRFVKTNQLGEVYTAFSQQVMRSSDYGQTWNQIDDFETHDGSGHWVGRGNSNLPGHSFCLETGTPGKYLWGSGEHGLWRNTDDGNMVYPGAIAVEQLTGQSHLDYDSLSISTIAVDPNNDSIYTLQFRQGNRGKLRKSTDDGATWNTVSTPVNFPGANDNIEQRSLLIAPDNPAVMYFCVPYSEWRPWAPNRTIRNGPTTFNGYGIYKSTDFGSSWTFAHNGIPGNKSVHRMAMDPGDSQTLYAALKKTHEGVAGGLYKTTDGGTSWTELTIPAGVNSLNEVVVHQVTGDVYIACGNNDSDGSEGGGFVSADGGDSWELIFDMPFVKEFEASVANPNVMVCNVGFDKQIGGLNPGCYVTADGGKNWQRANRQFGQPDRIRELRTDPNDESILWASVFGTGFMRMDISQLITESSPIESIGIAYRGAAAEYGDSMLAPDIVALRSGETATKANYTSYDRGLNRVSLEIRDLTSTTLTTDDFEFKVGNSADPSTWSELNSTTQIPLPTVTVSEGSTSGTHQVVLDWPDEAISNSWLQVTVKDNANTGLPRPDVFYLGNRIAETGDSSTHTFVNADDVGLTRQNLTGFSQAPIDSPYDFNRDGRVNADDIGIARSNLSGFSSLVLFTAP